MSVINKVLNSFLRVAPEKPKPKPFPDLSLPDLSAPTGQGKAIIEAVAARNGKIENDIRSAIASNDPSLLKASIKKVPKEVAKIFVNNADENGKTPLFFCGQSCRTKQTRKCIKLLLAAGADPLHKDNEGRNFVHRLVESGDFQLFEEFIDELPKGVAKVLVNDADASGKTPLFLMNTPCFSEATTQKWLKHLLAIGADPLHKDNEGRNYAHDLAKRDEFQLLQLFIDQLPKAVVKALVNAVANDGNTPLILSCSSGAILCMNCLLKAGANPDTFDKEGISPYEMALLNEKNELALELVQKVPTQEGHFAMRLLGHAFGFEPEAMAGAMAGAEKISGSTEHLMHKQIAKDLQRPSVREMLSSTCTEAQYQELTAAFDNSAIIQTSQAQFASTAEAIRRGELVILPTGWYGHAVTLVFRNGYLVICNRGEGCEESSGTSRTFFARKIDLTQVTPAVVRAIFKRKDLPKEEGIRYFYTELPSALRGRTDIFCIDILDIAPKPSAAGVCTYAAGKAALRAALALLTGDHERAKYASKAWATQHREWVLEYFQKTPSSFSESYRKKVIATQSGRLKSRQYKQTRKFLIYLQGKIQKKQSIRAILDELVKFYGKETREKIEDNLRQICQDKMDTSDPQFGKKKFLDPKFDRALKIAAIEMLYDEVYLVELEYRFKHL